MIKFIEYTGEFPCRCFGNLTVEIDGQKIIFGEGGYDPFWVTGGGIKKNSEWGFVARNAPWKLSPCWLTADNEHPQYLVDLMPQLIEVFNLNVKQGCCGGCI